MATREISTSLRLDGEKAFNDQMKAVNNNLKNLRSDMAVVTSEFADNADSAEALTAKQKNLSQQIEQQEVKVAALAQAYKDQAAAYGENSAQADKYRQAMNQAQAALNKMENQLEDTEDALDATDKTLQKMSSGLLGAGKAAGVLAAAGGAAVAALGALSAVGVAKMAEYAKEAAEAGTPGFETLAEHLNAIDASAASAKAALGGVLLPSLEALSGDGGKLLDEFSRQIESAGQDPEKLSAAFSSLIKNGVTMLRGQVPQMAELGMSLVDGIADGALESTPEMFDMAQEVLNVFLDGLDANADLLADGAVMLVTELVNFLGENSPDLLIAAVEILSALTTALAENAPQLVPAAVQLVTGLLVALVQNAPLLISSGAEMIGSILIGLLNELPNLVKFVPEMYQMIQDAVDKSVYAMLDVGKKIIDTILQGLKNAWSSVQTWFTNAVANLRGTANVTIKTDGSHAGGLNYVPYDGYIAELHRGEMVVPANEAQILRSGNFKGAGPATTINIYTQTLSEAQIDYLYKRFNAELGASI